MSSVQKNRNNTNSKPRAHQSDSRHRTADTADRIRRIAQNRAGKPHPIAISGAGIPDKRFLTQIVTANGRTIRQSMRLAKRDADRMGKYDLALPLKDRERTPEVKETKVIRTDPDAGDMVRDGKTDWSEATYKRRKETVEHPFADARQLRGHCYTRFRGLQNQHGNAKTRAVSVQSEKFRKTAENCLQTQNREPAEKSTGLSAV